MKITLSLVVILMIVLGVGIYLHFFEIDYFPTLATYLTAVLGLGIILFGGIGAVIPGIGGIGRWMIGGILLFISLLSSVTISMNF